MTERADDNGVIENLQSMINKLTNDKHDLEEKCAKQRLALLDIRYICQVANGKTTPQRLFSVYQVADKGLDGE